MSAARTVIAGTVVVGAFVIGFGTWSVMPPGEERKKEILKLLPESNALRMEETRKRNALMLQVLKEAAETKDNVARRFGNQK